MKEKLIVPILLLALLSGCAWPGGEYLSVTTHQAQHTTAHSGSLSAANYHQLRQVLTDLVEEALERISRTEDLGHAPVRKDASVGKRVQHPVFGAGTVIGTPRAGEGYIIQFDNMVTPRTFGPTVKLVFL